MRNDNGFWEFWSFSFGILESTSLSIARWVFTFPVSESILRELDSYPNWILERPPRPLIWIWIYYFTCIFKADTVCDSSISLFCHPHLTILHVFMWWRTCENGACAWLSLVDAQAWVHDVWLYNMVSLYSVVKSSEIHVQNAHISKLLFD